MEAKAKKRSGQEMKFQLFLENDSRSKPQAPTVRTFLFVLVEEPALPDKKDEMLLKGKGLLWILVSAVAVYLILQSSGPLLGWFLAGILLGAIGGFILAVWLSMYRRDEVQKTWKTQTHKKKDDL